MHLILELYESYSIIQTKKMSKSIEDYRNIIKILKLQLLKVREQNASLSHNLGISSESETSSYSPKINHYKQSSQPYAKTILAFLLFAHRCQVIGITPEMVFRIVDKQRDKKVSVNSFCQILKRLKLMMSEMEVTQLTNLVSRSNNHILYEEYLECLSAFQINSEKFPIQSSRTYIQLCLLKFGTEVGKNGDAEQLYKQINGKDDKAYLSFESYASFAKRSIPSMLEFQIIGVFVGLDLNSECQIQKNIFIREMGKVFSLIGRGVNIQEEISSFRDKPNKNDSKNKLKSTQVQKQSKKQKAKPAPKIEQNQQNDTGVKYEEQTGEQATNKIKKKEPKKQIASAKTTKVDNSAKLSKGDSVKIIGQFKKLGIRIGDLMNSLLNTEAKDILVRSFTIFDFTQAIRELNNSTSKKKIMQLFRALDTEANGTLDTVELLKLWLRGKQITDSDEILYRLLHRHLRQIQFPQPLQRFQVLGISSDAIVNVDNFGSIFSQLQLLTQEITFVLSNFIGNQMPVTQFAQKLKAGGKPQSTKKFSKMEKKTYDDLKAVLQKINAKRPKGNKQFRKLMRLETGQKNTEQMYWETIFNDEWACWEYCLQTAYKLQTFWRDNQFGPTKADPSGYRSIVGNESNVPPGLPDETEISWMSFQQILAKQQIKQKVIFMDKILEANDVVQGKIGDCWFVSALSIITANQQNIKGASIDKCRKSQECVTMGINPLLFKFFIRFGIYVFKYFKDFKPIYVLVDDLFPIETTSNELLFAKSPNPGVQWVSFLEKSYAKLHHSYSSMISGDISQGLNDMTRALPIKEIIQEGKPQNLDKIRRLNAQQQLMGCSITAPKGAAVEAPVTLDDQKCGLFYGHAYSIIDYLDLSARDENTFNLIRVRNPWGHGEWILDWSDTPIDNNPQYVKLPKYQPDLDLHYKNKIQQAKKAGRTKPIAYKPGDDGQFLIKFQDFNKIYSNLFTGYKFQRQYQCQIISEKWNQPYPSGICKLKDANDKQRSDFVKNNHQYLLQIKEDDTDVLMYIVQEDGRLYRGEKYPYKELCNGLMILSFNLGADKSLQKFDSQKLTNKNLKFELRREVNFWLRYKKGRYAIIPCKMKNNILESEFQFRIYSDKSVTIKKIKGPENKFRPMEDPAANEVDKGTYDSFLDLIQKYNQ